MAEALTTTYGGIEINYNEREDVWQFTLRGRERSTPTLSKAKEAIDKPVKNAKESTFQRIKGFRVGYSETEFRAVDVTSVAENGWGSRPYVWISDNGKREKITAESIAIVSDYNTKTIDEIKKVAKQRDALSSQIGRLVKSLTRLEIKTEEVA